MSGRRSRDDALGDALAATRADELRRAARALLRRPLVRAGDDDFPLIRRYAADLRQWFDRNTGWRLQVDNEVARLLKQPATTDDGTHPARDVRSKQPFGRRRYVLFCLALATLERADAQITLGALAEQVVVGAADPVIVASGVVFTMEHRDQRTDLVAVVRLLLDLGVLRRVAGDEDEFVQSAGDALYDVERRVLAGLLATPRGPSTVDAVGIDDRLTALSHDLPPTTDDLRNQRLRNRITRRLLDEPVVYHDELDDDERAYLTGQRAAITARITALTGLVAEVRAEGIAMVDPYDELSDVRMPESGTDGHATLLVAEHLAARGGRPCSLPELRMYLREQATLHRAHWRRQAVEPGADVELLETALDRLAALHLVRRRDGAVAATPALARYAVGAPTVQGAAR